MLSPEQAWPFSPEEVEGAALLFTVKLDDLDRDPLQWFRFRSPKQREVVKSIHEHETLLRGSNASGKSRLGGAISVALARGMKELDGEPLPPVEVPNIGYVLCDSYKQMLDSTQGAILKALGNWPHKIAYVQGDAKGYIESIHVKTELCSHDSGEKCGKCSKIVMHVAESGSAVGARVHWAWADEPPDEKQWREMRVRKVHGRKMYRWVTMTPLDATKWHWIKEDFDGSLDNPKNGRLELVTTLYDLHKSGFYTDEDVTEMERAVQGDPYAEARLHGDWVDIRGDCPFDSEKLRLWLRTRARPPKTRTFVIQSEEDTKEGRQLSLVSAEVEIYHEVEPDESYIGVLDPSLGIKSKVHDPAGIIVIARRRPRVVARYDGYIAPYGLGSLGAAIGTRYNNALLDVDLTGGYGGPCLTALNAARYRNVNQDMAPDSLGVVSPRLGFKITAINRQEITSAVQQAILEDSILIESGALIQSLIDTVVDHNGKWLAGPGTHDEGMICLGRGLHLSATTPLPRLRQKDSGQEFQSMLDRMFGSSAGRRRRDAVLERW